MKRVFLETHNLKNPYTGFGQFNLHLLRGLKNCAPDNLKFVVHTKDKALLKKEFGSFFEYKYYLGLRRYKWAQIRNKYAVWHSVNQNTQIEPYSNIPYVLTIHDVNFIDEISGDLNHHRNLRFIEKLNRANAITYISESAKASTHQHFKVPNVPEYVIHNGNPAIHILDLSNYKPVTTLEGPYLFSLGDFWPRKNFHVLVEMLQHLPDYKLIIAGNSERPYGESVRQTIQQLGLQDRVVLAGRISEEEKQHHLQHCDAFLFASLREGFGLPPLEAMSFGKPVFLSNSTSLPEIGGEHSFYWDEFDPKYMADKFLAGMEKFSSNQAFYQKWYVDRAKTFNWNNACKSYIEVYKQVLNTKK